jgi:hypothetical protein
LVCPRLLGEDIQYRVLVVHLVFHQASQDMQR